MAKSRFFINSAHIRKQKSGLWGSKLLPRIVHYDNRSVGKVPGSCSSAELFIETSKVRFTF
jgi:hypothetical protein